MNEADKKKATGEEEPAQEVRKERPRAVIIDDSGYRPELDPNAPEFDPLQYAEAIEAAGGMKKMTEDLAKSFRDIGNIIGTPLELDPAQFLTEFAEAAQISMSRTRDGLSESIENALKASLGLAEPIQPQHPNIFDMGEALNGILSDNIESVGNTIAQISAFVRSPLFRQINEGLDLLKRIIEGSRDTLETVYSLPENLKELYPFLVEEFKAMREAGELAQDFSLTDLFKTGFDEAGNPTAPIFEQALTRARERRDEQDKAETALTDIQKAITILESIKPTSHTMANNPLVNKMQEAAAIDAGEFDLTVSNPKGKRQEITDYVMLSYEGDEDKSLTEAQKKMTEYERQVMDSVNTLYLAAQRQNINPAFSPDTIYRAMPGGGTRCTPKQEKAIDETLEKYRRVFVNINATEQMRKRGATEADGTWIYNGPLLSYEKLYNIRTKNGGKKVVAYSFNTAPLLLRYSLTTKQLLTVPVHLLDIRKVKKGIVQVEPLKMNEGRQAMAGYMMRRIKIMLGDMKNKTQKQSHTILFKTLFEATGQVSEDRETDRRNRDFCFEVLDYWKAMKFIKGYEKQTRGKTITGVKLTL